MSTRSIIRTALVAVAAAACVTPTALAQQRFSLGLDLFSSSAVDPRTEARLAEWSSPMGRLQNQLAQARAGAGVSGLVGASHSMGVAFQLSARQGERPEVISAAVEHGIDVDERSLTVIRWPWQDEGPPAMPIEEQLPLLLGQQIETD